MMNTLGPSRLILIHTGKYDYGEVELTNPLHLVGHNNIGKTSLIAVLQFLYLDDQRSMHFSREMGATKKYYFPDTNSYILFECMTLSGYQVVGIHGLGPVRGHEFERFTYTGGYDPGDFIDENRCIRSPEEVRARLAAKSYQGLEPRQLRAALTGHGDNKGVNLGLVPIRQLNHYDRFRAVFGNLLRLAHLRQEELKNFLLEIHHGDFQQRSIDLEAGYSHQYQRVRSEAESLRDLKIVSDDIRAVLELAAQRDDLRRIVPGLWQVIMERHQSLETEITGKKQNLGQQQTQLADQIKSNTDQQAGIKKERDQHLQEIGKISGQLEEHQRDSQQFANFLLDFETSKRNEMEREIDRLTAALGPIGDADLTQVQRRLGRKQQELANLQRRQAQFANNVAATLLPHLEDSEAEAIFSLLNVELLGLAQGPEGLEIKQEKQLVTSLKKLSQHITAGIYEDEQVRLAMTHLSKPELSSFRDAQTLEERLAELQQEVQQDTRLLEVLKNGEEIKQEKARLQKEIRQLDTQLIRYQTYQERLPIIEQRLTQKQSLETRKEELEQSQNRLNQERAELVEKQRELQHQLRELDQQLQEMTRSLQSQRKPDASWPVEPYQASKTMEFAALLGLYEETMDEEGLIARRFTEEFRRIEQRTYGKYQAEDEPQTLALLHAEIEALDEREKAVEELWKSLAAGMQSAFKGLHMDLGTLQDRISILNRRLAEVSISNLAKLRIILRERSEWTRRIKTLVEVDSVPLFVKDGAVSEAQNQLGVLLNQHRRVSLSDLFDLQFEVTSSDGQTRRYPHLDSIESNGTTITIKVLINLLLLKGLLGEREVSLPFYLDEASSLDAENLKAIVEEARKLGFIAVLASPEAAEIADVLYFLRENNGRVLIDPSTSMVRIQRQGEESLVEA